MTIQEIIATVKQNGRTYENNRSNRVFFLSGCYRYRSNDFDVSNRYAIDFAPDFDGWLQFDTSQDASYFGVWVNPEKLTVLCYAEGDISIVECETVSDYNDEIQDLCDRYEDGRVARVISDDGVTDYVQDRTKFFITG